MRTRPKTKPLKLPILLILVGRDGGVVNAQDWKS